MIQVNLLQKNEKTQQEVFVIADSHKSVAYGTKKITNEVRISKLNDWNILFESSDPNDAEKLFSLCMQDPNFNNKVKS